MIYALSRQAELDRCWWKMLFVAVLNILGWPLCPIIAAIKGI